MTENKNILYNPSSHMEGKFQRPTSTKKHCLKCLPQPPKLEMHATNPDSAKTVYINKSMRRGAGERRKKINSV